MCITIAMKTPPHHCKYDGISAEISDITYERCNVCVIRQNGIKCEIASEWVNASRPKFGLDV